MGIHNQILGVKTLRLIQQGLKLNYVVQTNSLVTRNTLGKDLTLLNSCLTVAMRGPTGKKMEGFGNSPSQQPSKY